jgi:hypothetical protein
MLIQTARQNIEIDRIQAIYNIKSFLIFPWLVPHFTCMVSNQDLLRVAKLVVEISPKM